MAKAQTCPYTKWALEMERAASALQEAGLPSDSDLVRGNLNVATVLRGAANTEQKLVQHCRHIASRIAEFPEDDKCIPAEVWRKDKRVLQAAGLWREPGA